VSPAPSAPSVSAPARTPHPRATRVVVTAAAVVALAVHLWGLYRDHGPPSPRWFTHADKLEHLVGFGLPCLLVLLALHLRAAAAGRLLGARSVALVVGLFVLHAGVSEVVQGVAYTTRTGDPFDALADVTGTVLGLLGYLAVRRRLGAGAGRGSENRQGSRGRG
jgi:VanZ family protein